jgi:hypothetical protein
VAGRLVGVSLLRHGKGDRIHHGRQQILPDGSGVPCSSDELVEQGNLFVCSGVRRQELPEVDFNGFDLGWIVGLHRRVFGRGLILLRDVLGRGSPKSWQALQPPPVLVGEVHRLIDVDLVEALPPRASPTASAYAAPFRTLQA